MAFFEFNIAMSGLFAAQRGLQVTSNNITNATTKGYSKQELQQQASTPLSGAGTGMLGTGVSTTGITRIRDSYIDSKLWLQNTKLGEYNIKVTQNSLIEGVYGEPSESGFTTAFNNMFDAISDLSKNPTSGEAKIALRQELISFSKYFNNVSISLKQFQQDLNYELKATAQEINTLATRIQSLNKEIFQAELYGDDANAFRDERDLCIDRLSQIGNVDVSEYEEEIGGTTVKKFKVRFAGQTLVDHVHLNTLSVQVRGEREKAIDKRVKEISGYYSEIKKEKEQTPVSDKAIKVLEDKIKKVEEELKKIDADIEIEEKKIKCAGKELLSIDQTGAQNVTKLFTGKQNEEDIDDIYDVVWNTGIPFDLTNENLSGELKGIIDMRDGAGTGAAVKYNGVPYYIKRMDNYVREFSKAMNEQYSKDKDGDIEIIPIAVTGGKEVSYVKKDDKGNVIACYDADKNELILDSEDLKKVKANYSTKYKLFTYSTGNTLGEPEDGTHILGGDYTKITAENFSVSKEIFDDINNIHTTYDPENVSDTSFLLDLSAQKNNKHMFKEGDPKEYMIAIFSELGINAKEAKMYQSTQVAVTNTIENQRLSKSQVDSTEEFTNLIKYQQAYQSAAKIMNTIDGIYETTIFKLGNF
ncbi:flagellar hook-associated protein FlgK [Cellulosilyticum ruminicola]|uniref:flagellar hook-associated protein FlgK n=1 Tax=Cellulosilyticum ruminicola TaxID=425254 RepID=UPI0006D1F04B|nr:flagellar hook-associated protein FlgK [Cellulosilyticum ruminicola]